jgi:hypothetical protein
LCIRICFHAFHDHSLVFFSSPLPIARGTTQYSVKFAIEGWKLTAQVTRTQCHLRRGCELQINKNLGQLGNLKNGMEDLQLQIQSAANNAKLWATKYISSSQKYDYYD